MRTVPLSDVFPDRRGGYWGKDPGSSVIEARAVRNGDVGTSGLIAWSGLPHRGYTATEFERARLAAGDILLTTSGNCGNVAVVPDDIEEPIVATNFVRRLRVEVKTVDPRYAYHYLRSPLFGAAIRPFVRGATIQNLSVEAAFESVRMPVPGLVEQRRIAAILDNADTLRVKRHQVLTHLDSLPRAIFQNQFSGSRARTRVSEVALQMRTGPFGSQLLHEEFVDDGIAVLGLDNVVDNVFKWGARRFITQQKYEALRRYRVEPGDVLVSIMGTTGRCAVVPSDIPEAINTKHICAIRPDGVNVEPQFLRAAFLWHPESRSHLLRQTKGSIMGGLNMGIIKEMPIPLPSIASQREFAETVAGVTARRAQVESSIEAENELFASLQSRAFRGEL